MAEVVGIIEPQTAAADHAQQTTDGFHLVIDALKLNDIDTIFGLVGIPITDLARLAQAEGMRFIGFRHEQNAGNAAAISGYMTQKPGICLTVSAPGFLNGLTALANATCTMEAPAAIASMVPYGAPIHCPPIAATSTSGTTPTSAARNRN